MRYLFIAFLMSLSGLAFGQTTEPMAFTTTEGIELQGTLTVPRPGKRPVPVVLLIAGSGPTDRNANAGTRLQSNAYAMLADSLSRLGVAMLRYDKRGSGENMPSVIKTLKPEDHRFDYYINDAVGFIRQLQADRRFSKVIVAGHSEGSLVGMMAATRTRAAGFISLAGAGRNIADILKVQLGRGQSPETQQYINVRLDSLRAGQRVQSVSPGLMPLMNPRQQPGLISWMQYDPAVEIKKFDGPVLLVQGKHDVQVAVTEAEALHQARPDARLLLFDEMNHLLKNSPEAFMANIQTYTEPQRPLTPGLAPAIADFVLRL